MNPESKLVKVLVVDDSRTEQIMLSHILSTDPRILVIGTANNGIEALKFIQRHKPDIVTMDLNMPEMDGLEAARRIMESSPVPIIIVSMDRSLSSASSAMELIEAGAVAVVEKPFTVEESRQEAVAEELIRLVRNLSQVKLVHRWATADGKCITNLEDREESSLEESLAPTFSSSIDRRSVAEGRQLFETPTAFSSADLTSRKFLCLAIGASTGGPPVIKHILENIGTGLQVPVFIAQHMSPGFTDGFAHWLKDSTGQSVIVPIHGQKFEKGVIYLTPSEAEMGVDCDGHLLVMPRTTNKLGLHSVSYLFKTTERAFGSSCLAVLLSGMGDDGATELKRLRETGALTVVQDSASAVVYGMPGEALQIGAATLVLTPDEITRLIRMTCCRT